MSKIIFIVNRTVEQLVEDLISQSSDNFDSEITVWEFANFSVSNWKMGIFAVLICLNMIVN